jgi:conjugal transfer pilin signal peptidase TrbI
MNEPKKSMKNVFNNKFIAGLSDKLLMTFSALIISIFILFGVLNLRLGIENQEQSCLPFKVAITRYHQVDTIKRGDILMFSTNHDEMGDRFKDHIIVKIAAGIPGDVISVKNGSVSINGKLWGSLDNVKKAAAYMKRDPNSFDRTETVPEGKLLMLGTLSHSFDGRYWGFLPKDSILGTVYPIY